MGHDHVLSLVLYLVTLIYLLPETLKSDKATGDR